MPKIKKIRCPKCGKEPSFLQEILDGETLSFGLRDGVREKYGSYGKGGSTKVIAECDCGHHWTLRGVVQVTDLDIEQ